MQCVGGATTCRSIQLEPIAARRYLSACAYLYASALNHAVAAIGIDSLFL